MGLSNRVLNRSLRLNMIQFLAREGGREQGRGKVVEGRREGKRGEKERGKEKDNEEEEERASEQAHALGEEWRKLPQQGPQAAPELGGGDFQLMV